MPRNGRGVTTIPRNGSGVYSPPPNTLATTLTTIKSPEYNAFVNDLTSDANAARPIVAGGTGATSASSARANLGLGSLFFAQGRLTLQTGTAVPTSDLTAQTTVYYTPYVGNVVALYSGSVWVLRTFVETNLSLSGMTAGKPFDIFAYDNSGTLALESVVWTNDTTRATALALQDGVLVKTGDATRRYLGTIYTSATGQCEDSAAKRYVWNMYNRVSRSLQKLTTTSAWTYSTATWRQANADTANQLDFIRGLDEDDVTASLFALAANTATSVASRAGIGLDSTTALAQTGTYLGSVAASSPTAGVAGYEGLPGAGRHRLTWLEQGAGSGTSTFFGFSSGNYQTGLLGRMMG